MSFKKTGVNYYNDKLFKCLLQDNGKYFVELRNGVRIELSETDYNAIVGDLPSVNGVVYYQETLLSKIRSTKNGYVVEFINGNQFPISNDDFITLVEDDFVAIGQTYYNKAVIDKLFTTPKGYYVQLANGETVKVSSADYYSVLWGLQLVAVKGDTELFGEAVSSLQEDIEIIGDKVFGISNYVTGYTGFSDTTDEQSGNYVALQLVMPSTATANISVIGASATSVKMGDNGMFVARIGEDTNKVLAEITNNGETISAIYNLQGVLLGEAD